MRSIDTGHFTPAESRWVIRIGAALIVLALLPFVWMAVQGIPGDQWTFMGLLHNHQEGAVELSWIAQGRDGWWLTHYLHTPEPHDRTLIGVLYALLGQTARLTGLPSLVIFHLVRGGASLVMYITLYQLGAGIWMKQRPRRIFFLLTGVSGGFGWILAPLTGQTAFLDLTTPDAFPFLSTLASVHSPLTIAALALTAQIIIGIFLPGETESPAVTNSGLSIFILGLILAFIYPLALIPITIAFMICLGIDAYKKRALNYSHLRWLMWFVVPALPLAAYYVLLLRYNEVAGEVWLQSNALSPPSIPLFLLGLGLPFIIALPGIYRAIRHFEPDGDRFMLIWLATIVLLIYLPTHFHRRFAVGIMLPVAYFAVRALEDFWLQHVRSRRWHRRLFAAFLPILVASHFLSLILPLLVFNTANLSSANNIVLQKDYRAAFDWIEARASVRSVVLAAPDVALWIPPTTGAPVVYGGVRQTLTPEVKKNAVRQWYRETDPSRCDDLLQGAFRFHTRYFVRYVLVGPQERALGESVCLDALNLIETFGDVQIYVYTLTIPSSD